MFIKFIKRHHQLMSKYYCLLSDQMKDGSFVWGFVSAVVQDHPGNSFQSSQHEYLKIETQPTCVHIDKDNGESAAAGGDVDRTSGPERRLTSIPSMIKGSGRAFKTSGSSRSENTACSTPRNGERSEATMINDEKAADMEECLASRSWKSIGLGHFHLNATQKLSFLPTQNE